MKNFYTILTTIVSFAVSYGISIGLIKLITLCFGISFSLAYATGIWLIVVLLNFWFYKDKK